MTKKSIRNIVLRYVENNGPASWTELHNVVLTMAGQPLTRRNYGSSYLDRVSKGVTAMLPTSTDSRHLEKHNVDGKYHIVNK